MSEKKMKRRVNARLRGEKFGCGLRMNDDERGEGIKKDNAKVGRRARGMRVWGFEGMMRGEGLRDWWN